MGLKLSVLSGVALLAIYGLFRRQRHRAATGRSYSGSGPASHRPLEPFTGLDFQMKMHVVIPYLYQLYQRYGETFQVRTLFSPPAVITIAKENVQAINTSKDFGVEPMRLPGMEYCCGRGFITSDGDVRNHSKKLIRPSFDRSNLKDLSVLRDEVNALINSLPRDGSTVDLQPLLYTTFLNSAPYLVLGVYPSDVSKDALLTADQFVKSFHSALTYSMFRTLSGRVWKLLPQGNYERVCATAHNFLDYYVEKALYEQKQGVGGQATARPLSNKRSLMRSLSSQTYDKAFIRYQVLQGIMAARDTTSELLTNVFFLLARHQDYWDRLRAEIKDWGEDKIHDVDGLTSSRLISNILNETLRLTPIFPLIGRTALRDSKLPVGGGPRQDLPVIIPKGSMVVMSYYSMHRKTSIFGHNIDEFRPDRWNKLHSEQWEFMGFGAGNRACLGQHKALIEASYVLVRFARAISEIHSKDNKPWQGELKMTCKSANGCKVSFE